MGDTIPLTGKQQEIFAFIRGYIEEHGYPPAIRDELTMEHVNRARAHAPRVCGGDALTEWMSKPGNALPETDQLAYVLRMQLAIDGRRFTREQAIAKWDVVGGMTPID